MKEEHLRKITELRHLLHRHPELSGREKETIGRLKSFLRQNTSLEIVDRDGWFYAVKKGASGRSPLAFRADMDALPMEEGTDLSYASVNRGVSHKCGHDGHMAALCGLALGLDRREAGRTVFLIFQPAEETGQGALRCRELIREEGISGIYAFHNLSGYPENSVVFRRGLTQPSSEGLTIRLAGRPSHAAAPEEGNSPAARIAGLALRAPETAAACGGKALCTVVGMSCGSGDFGISPGEGQISFTLRAERGETLKEMEEDLLRYASSPSPSGAFRVSHSVTDYFPETVNHDGPLGRVLALAEAARLETVEMKEMWRASEDFGYYLKECPGAMFYIGNGVNYPPVHTDAYDFNDRILPTAADLFLALAEDP